METLKFRAWHHGGGDTRVQGFMNYSKDNLRMFFENVENEDLAVEVMQYTGINDKENHEIYNDDILEWDAKEWGFPYYEVVEFNYEQLSMRKNDWATFCKVVGNIYENPEFLIEVSNENNRYNK